MSKRFLTPVAPPALGSDPANGVSGAIYYNTVLNKLKVYNGTSWTPIGGAATALEVLPDDPETGVQGQIYFNSNQQTFRGFNGIVWYDVGGPKAILEHDHAIDGLVNSVDYGNYVSEDKVFANAGSTSSSFMDNYIDGGGA
jgi:hypothetical protein